LQVVLVSVVIGLFYIAFGIFAVREDTIVAWTSLDELGPRDELGRFTMFGTELVVTVVLLRVVGFIVAFSALQFALAAVTDATYREEFFDEVTSEVRHALAVRSIYLDEIIDDPTPDE
jgi:multisubunit Na+/H+ antiporter MnhB subunit